MKVDIQNEESGVRVDIHISTEPDRRISSDVILNAYAVFWNAIIQNVHMLEGDDLALSLELFGKQRGKGSL